LNDVNPDIVEDPADALNKTLRMVPLPPEEEVAAQRVLRKVRNFVTTCRIGLKPIFHDFDRAIKGVYQTRVCTGQRFMRALAVNKIATTLSGDEMAVLVKKYSVVQADGTIGDDVNYTAFIHDVEDLPDSEGQLSPSRVKNALLPTGGPLSPIANSAEEAIKKVVTVATNKKVRLGEFFKDFDPLRSGTVPQDKFASALAIAGIQLADSEIQLLIKEYASERVKDHTNITRFLRDTDENVAESIASLTLTNTMTKRKAASRPVLTDEEREQWRHILDRIAHTVKSRNILLPPFFADFDKHHSGRITTAQFDQVLSRHKLPLSTTDVNLLNKAYADIEDRGRVFYREFIGDVDETENVSTQLVLRNSVRRVAENSGEPVQHSADVEATLRKICGFIQRRNVRIEEFFRDSDPLRHHTIPKSRFRIALSTLGCPLVEGELLAIERHFHSATRIPDGFDYAQFIAAVNERLDSGELFTPTESLTATKGADTSKLTPFASELVERLRRQFDSRRLSARPTFQSFDTLRKGKVTRAQFFSTLTTLGVRFSQGEMNALAQVYQTDDGMVNYNGFCADVDAKTST
jgi:Ca2+-binding EF-hand superfamily protein